MKSILLIIVLCAIWGSLSATFAPAPYSLPIALIGGVVIGLAVPSNL